MIVHAPNAFLSISVHSYFQSFHSRAILTLIRISSGSSTCNGAFIEAAGPQALMKP